MSNAKNLNSRTPGKISAIKNYWEGGIPLQGFNLPNFSKLLRTAWFLTPHGLKMSFASSVFPVRVKGRKNEYKLIIFRRNILKPSYNLRRNQLIETGERQTKIRNFSACS